MRIPIALVFIFLFTVEGFSQSYKYTPSNSGTRNYASGINSFEYGIIGSNQDATGSPVGLVASIVRKVPSAKKLVIDMEMQILHYVAEIHCKQQEMKSFGILMG